MISKHNTNTFMYHITPNINLVSILTTGLKINRKNKGVTLYNHIRDCWPQKYGCMPIFLTSDPCLLIRDMLGTCYRRELRWQVLSVDVGGLNLAKGYYDGEYIYTYDIERCNIKYVCPLDIWPAG